MMLFDPHFSEKNDTQFKQVKAQAYFLLLPDFLPGFFHTGRPVDVVQYKDTISVRFCL